MKWIQWMVPIVNIPEEAEYFTTVQSLVSTRMPARCACTVNVSFTTTLDRVASTTLKLHPGANA